MRGGRDNKVSYRLQNSTLGFGAEVSWNSDQLPYLTQWKMMGQGEYVLGLEPGNCYPMGRAHEMKHNRLDLLQSFEEKNFSLSVELFDR